ncbi:ribonuclease domain-containing protein [Amycolatopsis sp. NPDC059027]|uniref:ribonuclease domain-containing protein n=1 Tax=unclassified Amycolatopsis TaxID=2618356 RepID=UPI00366B5A75
MTSLRRFARVSALITLASGLLLGSTTAAVASPVSVGSICTSDLPTEAHETLDLIAKDGPFPYPQDGTVFGNREGILPSQPSGYYHEYTVETPGSETRGARRIVTGEREQEDYYTADHYESFDLIDFTC